MEFTVTGNGFGDVKDEKLRNLIEQLLEASSDGMIFIGLNTGSTDHKTIGFSNSEQKSLDVAIGVIDTAIAAEICMSLHENEDQ